MQRALITGIAGFTGWHMTKLLIENSIDVYGFDLPSACYDNLTCFDVKIFHGDITNSTDVSRVIHLVKPDYVFHLAALLFSDSLAKLFAINVSGTQNILECISNSQAKVLVPGSGAEYGFVKTNELPVVEETRLHPVSIYAASKVAQTLLTLKCWLKDKSNIYIARPFNIIGPHEPESFVCSSIAKQIIDIEIEKKEGIIHVGNLDTQRDFIDVRDVVRAYWLIVSEGIPGEIYNVCSGEATPITQVIETFRDLTDIHFKIHQDSSKMKMNDIPIHYGSNEKLKKTTGWQMKISFRQTLCDILNYYRNIGIEKCND